MSSDPIREAVAFEDLTQRFVATNAVVASPALAAETVIAQLAVTEPEQILAGVQVDGWAAFTVGATGASARLRIRRTNLAGAVVADTGALTGGVAAAALLAQDIAGLDAAPVPTPAVYVLTLTIAGATGASAVSGVSLRAIAV